MTSSFTRPTQADINHQNLIDNFKSITSFVGPESEVLAVVKADSYGHGAVSCAKSLEMAGCGWFGVAIVEEALELRQAGISSPVLVLGGFWPAQADVILDYGLTPVVYRLEAAAALNSSAERRGVTADAHLKVDTGMGRLGVRWDEVEEFARELRLLKNLRIEGVMSHFAAADDLGENDFTRLQEDRFRTSVETMKSLGFNPTYCDIANSPGAVAHPETRPNMVRIGGILYGLGDDVLPGGVESPKLSPVMSIKSQIAHIKMVPAGESLGYGRSFTTGRESVIASVPMGYHDGLPRCLSNAGEMIVRGRRVPIVGRVSMDWTLIDVTDVANADVSDEVMIIGRQGSEEIRASDLAKLAGTISYEITCGIGARVPRKHVTTG